MSFEKVESVLDEIRAGKMVIVVDEEDRENEGDLTMAAEKVTPEAINFMATHGRGLICMPMSEGRLDELKIPLMVTDNESVHGTAFCVSIEARRNVSTGISAADRAMTVLTAIDESTRPEDLIRPGHIFPLRSRKGGVLERAGQTEAAVDLSRLAGLKPAGVICEIMNPDGSMARMPELQGFSKEHGIRIISVVDLIKYRLQTERFVRKVESVPFESDFGSFVLHLYENQLDRGRHLVFVKGEIDPTEPTLLRVHTESVLSDLFLSRRLEAGNELRSSLEQIQREGRGVLIYLRMKDREDRLFREVCQHRTEPPDTGEEHHPAGFRDYGVGAQIIADLGLRKVVVLTNHPKKMVGLEGFDIDIVEQRPIPVRSTAGRS
ncbi:MAG TPA: 3,4-dihydroxy-2-butanone-4-phosphate synthase [Acidobacteriota bacterium]|nr:3,4-dihydroxy-2-butanone-4-phosphate synthase [Acidobacteriota bacterium]